MSISIILLTPAPKQKCGCYKIDYVPDDVHSVHDNVWLLPTFSLCNLYSVNFHSKPTPASPSKINPCIILLNKSSVFQLYCLFTYGTCCAYMRTQRQWSTTSSSCCATPCLWWALCLLIISLGDIGKWQSILTDFIKSRKFSISNIFCTFPDYTQIPLERLGNSCYV